MRVYIFKIYLEDRVRGGEISVGKKKIETKKRG